jgi:hypothetical protein
MVNNKPTYSEAIQWKSVYLFTDRFVKLANFFVIECRYLAAEIT